MANKNINFKAVAFPREHGSWGFVLEPLTLSVIIAFSTNGLLIALASFLTFLAHQPIRIILKKGIAKKLKRNAVFFLGLYSLLAVFSMIPVIKSEDLFVLTPLFFVMVLMLYFLYLETSGLARNVYAELIAPVSINIIALSIVLAGNWQLPQTLALFIVLLNRSVPTTFYIHEKLNSLKNNSINSRRLIIVTITGLIAVVILAFMNLVPYLSVIAVLILAGRIFHGFTKKAKRLTVKQIGMLEFLYGTIFVIVNAIGYLYGL